ncbi:Phosphomannomutase [Denitrovibrio acetiphilus DSM 12809]|uniref:Phosphomannomutase n=1 Tax=Denitrovibrio acetiphilus (strain DSM 12809 / NBRC 114555 / N2460) TaxID=522772 RepID=D4H606_DENA2|nr:phosphomannomutase/phosphoglucomutase [Denitrovibrio acetiphilus]ADD67652.1 Phosphomannomutase [Denitrovibrio acetiphilus DSM 12809]
MLRGKDIFRKYDIRGVYGKTLNCNTAESAAKAFATQVISETGEKHPTLSVGRDVRESSSDLFEAVCNGLTSSGVNVVDLGVCPSPLAYFSMYSEQTDGYIMITGSHNPPEFNGIKVGTKNTVYHSEKIEQIYTDIIMKNFPKTDKKGFIRIADIKIDYINYLNEHFKALKDQIKKLSYIPKIVIDAGSGTASDIAPVIFKNLGVEVHELYCTPDGSFPGHHPDPTVESNMAEAKELLLKIGADFAVGFDGDADRLGALDNKGRMMWGDQLIGVFAHDIAQHNQGRKIVADVKASKGLYEHIEAIGMVPVMYLSGHSMIKEKMKQEKAVLGGEMSSHFFFADRYFGFDDGIYASVRLLEAYVKMLTNGTIRCSADMTDIIPAYINTPEIRKKCQDEVKFQIIKELERKFIKYLRDNTYEITDIISIDGLRITFDSGWALIRASNTEPLLVTRYEAVSKKDLHNIRQIVEREIKETKYDIQKKDQTG